MNYDDVAKRIVNLDDSEAIKMLNTIASPHVLGNEPDRTLDTGEVQALKGSLQVRPAKEPPTDGEIARMGLQVMAQNPDCAEEIEEYLLRPDMRVVQEESPVANLEPHTLIYALKSSVDFRHFPDGHMEVNVTPKRPQTEIIRGFAEGLLARLPHGLPGK